jgi:hypothetical protein
MFVLSKGSPEKLCPNGYECSDTVLITPVHIYSFLKVEKICKGEISGCYSSNYDVLWDIPLCRQVEID